MGTGRAIIMAVVSAMAGCVVASTSHHESAYPERRSYSLGMGFEALRNYTGIWDSDASDSLVVGPAGTLSFAYAPTPGLNLGIETYGSGVGFKAKKTLGQADSWAGAVTGLFGFLAGDDSGPWDDTPTWTAGGFLFEGSGILSTRTSFTTRRKQGHLTFSAGPKLVYAYLDTELISGTTWAGSVIDYGGFVGAIIERGWLRFSLEGSLLRLERPRRDERRLRPFGGFRFSVVW